MTPESTVQPPLPNPPAIENEAAKPGLGRRVLKAFILLAVVAFVVMPVSLTLWMLRLPRQPVAVEPSSVGLAFQNIEFTTEDGLKLSGWFIPGDPNKTLFVFAHGVGASRVQFLGWPEKGLPGPAYVMAQEGHPALLFDMRRCGRSQGRFITYGCKEVLDLKAALQFVRRDLHHQGKVVAWGISLGAAVALLAAPTLTRENPPLLDGIIAETSFDTLPNTISHHLSTYVHLPPWPYTPALLAGMGWLTDCDLTTISPLAAVAALNSPLPILFVGSDEDQRIPTAQVKRLYDAYPFGDRARLYVASQGTHGGLWYQDPRKEACRRPGSTEPPHCYRMVVENFLRDLVEK